MIEIDLQALAGPELDAAAQAALESVEALDGWWRNIERCRAVAAANKHLRDEAYTREQNALLAESNLKAALLGAMTARNLKKVQTSYGDFARQTNGGALPVEIDPTTTPENAPPEFVVTKYEWDKKALAEALSGGEVITFARLGTRGEHLRLK